MYCFYERAAICFAYLRDVSVDTFDDSFVKSEWFTRGWTLQELLAPTNLQFYDCNWTPLGDKKTLSHLISAATGIQDDVLIGKRQLRECSVAQRMSWAARRVTTRVEDRAYSLLGIFDVNMAMLYGEGPKSFLRLQEEIIKTLDDHSIFVWEGLQPGLPGLLASLPDAFASSGDVRNTRGRKGRRPYIVNNRGLHGLVPLIPYTLDTYLTLLPCTRQDPAGQIAQVGIFLRRLYEDDQFMRVSVHEEEVMQNATAWVIRHGVNRLCVARSISIRQSPLLPEEMDQAYVERIQGFRLNEGLLRRDTTSTPLFSISGAWDSENRIVSLPPGSRKIHHVGSINIGPQEREIEIIRFGYDYDYNPVVYLTQKGVRYSEEEDQRGVFMQSFKGASEDEETLRLLPSGENFQNASVALGGHWSRSQQLPDGIWVAQMSANVNGFWALKADRLDGLDVYIIRVARQLDKNNMYSRVGRMQLRRAMVDEHLIWDLQLDVLAPRREHQRSEEVRSASSHFGNAFLDDVKQITGRIDGLSFESRDS